MIKDLKFETFKNRMKNKTKKLVRECNKNRLDEEDAVSLDFYDEIEDHLCSYVFKERIEDVDVDNYNIAYNDIERLYIDYLRSLLK